MAEQLPMLATASTGASNRAPVDVATLVESGGWVLDTKLDGIRAWWNHGRLTNRVGVDITERFPEVVKQLDSARIFWLDGEIVANDGKFETVAQRDKLEQPARRKQGAEANPCTFVAFDYVSDHRKPWTERRESLEIVCKQQGITVSPISYDVEFIDTVKAMGLEGVIAKRVSTRYQFGKRSPDWIKHKFTQRISCLVAGYEAGSNPLGALKLALFDHKASRVVEVGRCGSGFTEKQRADLKQRLDAGEILVAEIEALNLTSHHTLRFPVYRGLRTDVAPLECTVDQLDTLPRSGKSF